MICINNQDLSVGLSGGKAYCQVLASLVQACGHQAVKLSHDVKVVETVDSPPVGLIIFAPEDDDALEAAVLKIRGQRHAWATVPMLACASTMIPPQDLLAADLDGCLPLPLSAEAMAQALGAWLPGDMMAAACTLADTFGQTEIMALVTRLRDELQGAVRMLDDSGAAPHAHRIAGVAGTLGFTALGEAWLRLSEHDLDAAPDARRTARIAIAAIDRHGLKSA